MRIPGRRLFLLALVAVAPAGCKEEPPAALEGGGVPATETRDVPAFTRLSVGSRIEAHVTIGEASKLEFRADKNLLPHVVSRVENGQLTLDTDVKVKPSIPLRVDFKVPQLDAVTLVKGANVVIEKLHAAKFEATLKDAAKLRVTGSARTLVLDGATAASFDFRKAPSGAATIRLDKAARAEMGYLEKLDVKLSDVSRVAYDGTPEIKKEVKGRAALIQRDR